MTIKQRIGDFFNFANGSVKEDFLKGYSVSDYGNFLNVTFTLVETSKDTTEEIYAVYKVKDKTNNEEVLIKCLGYYSSYNGTEFSKVQFVQPIKKIVYEEIV